MHRHLLLAVLAALTGLAHASVATAGPDFGYVYTAEIEEPGETELTLWGTDRRGKGDVPYNAQDYRLEVERGITPRFQASLHANFASNGGARSPDFTAVHRSFAFSGASAELKYQLRDPGGKGLGLALYAEPGWSRYSKVTGERVREFELEIKAIVQKNLLADRLVWAANLTFEPEWERELSASGAPERTEKELAIELASGVTYRVQRSLWLGVEGRYHSIYPDWTAGLHRENYAVFAGPSVHFEQGEWGVTAAWQPQLFGSPHAPGRSLEFHDHEARELRLKIAHEF